MRNAILTAIDIFLSAVGDCRSANGIAIIITCGTLLTKMVTIPKEIKRTKGKQIRLGSDLEVCDWGTYLCLVLAPFINIAVYFISILILYVEYGIIVRIISQNQLLILISLILIGAVAEISMFVVVGVNFKRFISTFGKGIFFFIWNIGIACMFSMIWGYMFFFKRENLSI